MYIIWTIAGISLLLWDLIKSSTIKLTLASSCLFCAIAAYKFTPKAHYQLLCFIALTVAFYFLIRTILKKEQKDILKLTSLDDIIGKQALVKKDIAKVLSADGLGFVEYNNELWNARSVDDKEIKAGEIVEIVSRENMIFNVKVKDNANQ